MRSNRTRLRLVSDTGRFAKPVEQELDLEPELQTAGTDLKSPRDEAESLPEIEFKEPWTVDSDFHHKILDYFAVQQQSGPQAGVLLGNPRD